MLQKIHISITAILLGGCIVLLLLWQKSCNKASSSVKDIETLMSIHIRDSSELVWKTNKLGQPTVTAEAFELSQKTLTKYVAENSSLNNKLANSYKSINSLNVTISNFHKDTIRIPVPKYDTLPCGDIDKSYPVVDKDKFYSFDFKFKNRQGHEPEYYFLNFNIPDTTTDVIGVMKSGFLNMKRTLVSEQTHTNKLIKVGGVQTIVSSAAKPKRIGIGASTGYGLSFGSDGIARISPYVGLSVNYNLFEF